MNCVIGRFTASDAAFNVECGFIPDHIKLISALGGTELEFDYWGLLEDLETDGQYGMTYSTTGVPGPNASGSGIVKYDSMAQKVMLPAPSGSGEKSADMPEEWTQARSSAATARTTSALGTIIKPTASNATGVIFECTTAGTGAATEPTWPTLIGDTVLDGSTVWTARENKVKNVGVKGFTVQAGIATNGEVWIFKAIKADRIVNMGDADLEDPVQFSQPD